MCLLKINKTKLKIQNIYYFFHLINNIHIMSVTIGVVDATLNKFQRIVLCDRSTYTYTYI